ncbi:glycoside hydrolase family 43 protein [Aridibaculum aurantiacum]|uniref:glycoside hydrolase family 43 protein n=1 Tax=Aridibaculum aurantiacum TaxID=2810307 RepID=UPI001A97C0F0|nr:glycoside hydrolase family 43 protein [Aridibaculum aurantiacum]
MKKILNTVLLLTAMFASTHVRAQAPSDTVYMFSYFKGSGDGLHLAYSEDGYKWTALFNDSIILKPTVSKDKLMRDPCIIKGGDGKYHMVWTVSWNDRGIGYASSPDLVNWSEQQFLPVMMHEDSARNTWAPEITYDPKKKQYMIYWATSIRGRFPTTDTAAEAGYNHRMYYVTTKDFKKYSKTKLLYDPNFSVIDATILKDGKRWVMFLKNETRYPVEKNLRVAYGKKLTGPYTAAGPAFTGKYWAEGPTALRINNEWIVFFDKYRDHVYGAVTSTDLVSWKDVSAKLKMPKGIRHGTAFTITREELNKLLQAKL